MKGNKLLIKYNHKEEEETNTSSQLQAVKDYIQKSGNNVLTREDLEKENKQDNSSSGGSDGKGGGDKGDKTGLCWGIGIIGILLIFGIFIIARIRKRKVEK